MKNINDMSKEELKERLAERIKWERINSWTRIIGTSILLGIFIYAIITKF